MCDENGGRRCDPGCLAAGNSAGDCCWFHDRKQVARVLKQALNEWNMRGQANARFRYVGETTATMGSGADVVVNMQACFWNDGSCSGACATGAIVSGTCGSTMTVPIYKWSCATAPDSERRSRVVDLHLDWNSVGTSAGRGWSAFRIFMHEFGHVLGLPDVSGPPPNGTVLQCGGGAAYQGGPTNMFPARSARDSFKVWPEDAKALQTGVPFSYGVRSSDTLHHARRNLVSGRTPEVNPGTATNLTPSVAFARIQSSTPWCTSLPCPTYVVAYSSPLFGIVGTHRTNGYTWTSSAVPGGASQHTPEVAGRDVANCVDRCFLLVYIASDNESTHPVNGQQGTCPGGFTPPCVNYLFWATSADGENWSSPLPILIGGQARSAMFKAALTYSPAFDKFHLVFPELTFHDDDDGGLRSLTYDPIANTWTESSPAWLSDAAPHARTVAGPPSIARTCRVTCASRCGGAPTRSVPWRSHCRRPATRF
jgi:hypothetical protein